MKISIVPLDKRNYNVHNSASLAYTVCSKTLYHCNNTKQRTVDPSTCVPAPTCGLTEAPLRLLFPLVSPHPNRNFSSITTMIEPEYRNKWTSRVAKHYQKLFPCLSKTVPTTPNLKRPNSVKGSRYWEARISQTSKIISCILRTPKTPYHIQNILPVTPVLIQTNAVHLISLRTF